MVIDSAKAFYRPILTGAFMVCAASSANASLIGDSVNGTLGTDVGNIVTTQFTSPAVVGGGIEFTGTITDVFNQIWTIDVDIAASSFSVAISESEKAGNGNFGSGLDILSVELTDLDWTNGPGIITDVALNSYSCLSAGFSCTAFGSSGPDISILNFTDNSLAFSSKILRDGQLYVFDISTQHSVSVPEPGTLALLGLGLAGIGFARRKPAS